MASAAVAISLMSCTTRSGSDQEASVDKEPFGEMPDGTPVDEYTLINKNGIQMKVITYGGIITSLRVPDREGQVEDIVLGYDDLASYLRSSPYFGAIIGRYGNRIAKGKFRLDGKEYQLATNDMGNHLHGGNKGFDKVVWHAEPTEVADGTGLKLTYTSPDMEEGYPGNLDVEVVYELLDDNSLRFEYTATTDKATVINLTNHTYYNLSSMKENILGHELQLNASRYLPVDSTLIPLGIDSVKETPFDFTRPKAIGKDIDVTNTQLTNGKGYDHCWVLDGGEDTLRLAAALYEPKSGRSMKIYTTEPAIQFYSGNFLDGSNVGKNGVPYAYRTGLCLETEHYPDSPNRPDFPNVILRPGERYQTTTVTKFSTQ